jgi:hypothetical protein
MAGLFLANGVFAGVEIIPTTGRNIHRLAVAELDGNRAAKEIVGSTYDDYVCALAIDGKHLWDAPTGGFAFDLAIGDLDGNGRDEIMAASVDSWVYVFASNGELRWKQNLNAPVYQVAIAKLDGKMPVVLAGTVPAGTLRLLELWEPTKTLCEGWTKRTHIKDYSASVIENGNQTQQMPPRDRPILVMQGNFLAEATQTNSLQVVAVLKDETALAGAHDIEISDGLAYVAGKGFTSRALPGNGVYPYEKGKGGSLAVLDVKQPAAPKLLWSSATPLAYEDAETVLPLSNGRLLVGTRDVFLFDVSSPSQVKEIAAIRARPAVDIINGFARLGDSVFAANKQGYIFAVDVSAPDTLKLLGVRRTHELDGLTKPHDVAFCGDLLVIVSPEGFGSKGQPGRLAVYRVADPQAHSALPPEQWTLVGKLEHPRLAGANRVMTRGKFAYVGSSLSENANRQDDLRNNVSVVDLSDPAAPRLRGSLDFPDSRGPNGLELAGSVIFAAGGQTVQAIDVANPEMPCELGRLTAPDAFPGGQDDAHDLVYHEGHLFITAQNSHSLVVVGVADERMQKGAHP